MGRVYGNGRGKGEVKLDTPETSSQLANILDIQTTVNYVRLPFILFPCPLLLFGLCDTKLPKIQIHASITQHTHTHTPCRYIPCLFPYKFSILLIAAIIRELIAILPNCKYRLSVH